MRTPADMGGRRSQKRVIFSDVLYGRPLVVTGLLSSGPSIKDVRRDGGGVWSNADTCGQGRG